MLSSLIVATMLTMANDPDGVVSTAPKGDGAVIVGAVAPTAAEVPSVASQEITPHGLSTDEQIDRWIAQRAEASEPFSGEAAPWAMEEERKIHGEVSAAIGTGDFSAYSAAVSIPVGENATVNLSYSRSKNGYGYGGYGYGYDGYGPGYSRYDDGYGVPLFQGRDRRSSTQSFGASWSNERGQDRDGKFGRSSRPLTAAE